MLNRRGLFGLLLAGALGAAGLMAAATTAAEAQSIERTVFDQQAFDAALAEGGPVLIDIKATWCTTCQQQAAVLDLLYKMRPEFGAIKIFTVDYDTRKDVMRSFGATQRATLIAFKDGAEVGRLVFETRPSIIQALLDAAI